jgi:hypothetical protein
MAKVAWDSITLRNVGVDRVRKAKVSSLKCVFDVLTFHNGESMDDFNACIGWIMNQLAFMGYKYKEEEVVRWFLLALPHKFEQIVALIETLLDVESMMVDEVVGHLKPTVEHISHNCGNMVASLNLTEDELVALVFSRLKVSGNGGPDQMKEASSSKGKHSHGRGKGRRSSGHDGNYGGCDAGDRGNNNAGHGRSGDVAKGECRYYSKCGHWAYECRKKKKDKEAHVAQVEEEDESTLLITSATITEPDSPPIHLGEGVVHATR